MKKKFNFAKAMGGGIISCLRVFKAKRFVPLVIFTFSLMTSSIYGQDTLICDNGGFENGFQYYKGKIATFYQGSNTCTPLNQNGSPSVFTNTNIPLANRFQIVTSGIDPLINIPRTKFGNKSLRLNSQFGHQTMCENYSRGVDRLIKRFKVTQATRKFTVWYALALENPDNHVNQQPFFSIRCDKAPASDLCFDADILKCEQIGSDICGNHTIDVLNWACHTISIPADQVGQIATVEITMGDCGAGGHFGYAYIDGFCESCFGSATGSAEINNVNYESCGTETARVCGSFSTPTICNLQYDLINVSAEGYTIQNLVIDNVNKTYCFDFPISNFPNGVNCIDICAGLTFTNNGQNLPVVPSGYYQVCKNNYVQIPISPPTAVLNVADYVSCLGNTASVCGTFTAGTCIDGYALTNVIVPGYNIQNLVIDNGARTFCFDFPLSNFPSGIDCLNINAHLTFSNSTNGQSLPIVITNNVQICKNNYMAVPTPVNLPTAFLTSIEYLKCDNNAKVCGYYTNHIKCVNEYYLDFITVNGYPNIVVDINRANQTFCFNFPISNFGSMACKDLIATLRFIRSNNTTLDIPSSSINICKANYKKAYDVTVSTGTCNDNATGIISDDYYKVALTINDAVGVPWTVERQLTDPYSNESGLSVIASGTGNKTLNLGPFYILEGAWTLTVKIGGCEYPFSIEPPLYCSGCQQFRDAKIGKVKCNPPGNLWNFVIDIPKKNSTSSYFLIDGNPWDYDNKNPVPPLSITKECITFTLTEPTMPQCTTKVKVCPPKPCKTNQPPCELEVHINDVDCITLGNSLSGFNADFEASTITAGQSVCYQILKPTSATVPGAGIPGTGLTNQADDLEIMVFLCPVGSNCSCVPDCYKIIQIPAPKDCDTQSTPLDGRTREEDTPSLKVVPNPFASDEIHLISTLKETHYEIVDMSGQIVHKGQFVGDKHTVSQNLRSGVYIIVYSDGVHKARYIKAIKL